MSGGCKLVVGRAVREQYGCQEASEFSNKIFCYNSVASDATGGAIDRSRLTEWGKDAPGVAPEIGTSHEESKPDWGGGRKE